MCKQAAKILPFPIRYIPDQQKTQQMCYKGILKNSGTLKSIPDCYKNQKLCDKAVYNYPNALELVSEYYKTQKCVITLLILILLYCNYFLNAIRRR